MSTHGCIRIYSEEYASEYPDGILLHTTHTGMDIPIIVAKAPLLILDKRFYIKTRDQWISSLKHDGSIHDWLYYPMCVASLLIAAAPMTLTHVFNNDASNLASWSGADHPYKLIIRELTWCLRAYRGKLKIIDPAEVIMQTLPER